MENVEHRTQNVTWEPHVAVTDAEGMASVRAVGVGGGRRDHWPERQRRLVSARCVFVEDAAQRSDQKKSTTPRTTRPPDGDRIRGQSYNHSAAPVNIVAISKVPMMMRTFDASP